MSFEIRTTDPPAIVLCQTAQEALLFLQLVNSQVRDPEVAPPIMGALPTRVEPEPAPLKPPVKAEPVPAKALPRAPRIETRVVTPVAAPALHPMAPSLGSRIVAAFASDESYPLHRLATELYGAPGADSIRKLKTYLCQLTGTGRLRRTGAASWKAESETSR